METYEIEPVKFTNMTISSELELIVPYQPEFELTFKICPTQLSKDKLTDFEFIQVLKKNQFSFFNLKDYFSSIDIYGFKFEKGTNIVSWTYDHDLNEVRLNSDTHLGIWFNLNYTPKNQIFIYNDYYSLKNTLFPLISNSDYWKSEYFTLKP